MKLSEVYLRAAEAVVDKRYKLSWREAVGGKNKWAADCFVLLYRRGGSPPMFDDDESRVLALLFAHEMAKDEGL